MEPYDKLKIDMDANLKRRKRIFWRAVDETEVISLWEEFESELRKEKRNAHVYEEISKRMHGRFSAKEIHIKIGNLTQKYRSERKENGDSSTWMYYNSIHKIIGSKVVNDNNEVASSKGISEDPLLVPLRYNSPSPSISRSTSHSQISLLTKEESDAPRSSSFKKRKKINYDREILKDIKKQTRLYETQLSLLKNTCEDFSAFLHRQEQRENAFLEIFQKLKETF